ncbi:MAG TPA: efflux RND transporter permease subunit [Aquifex aeolicus]|nr:efflux RND transporter permease subunit [Aquifex aeolicus]
MFILILILTGLVYGLDFKDTLEKLEKQNPEIKALNRILEEGLEIREAVKRTSLLRLRPILITATTTFIGLLPLLIITDIGSEVQKPLATVVVGGIITSTILTLLIIPTVYEMVYRRFSRT